MLLVGLLVLATSGMMAMAQENITCECFLYSVCDNRPWNKDVECQYHNEVCCEIDPTDLVRSTTESVSIQPPLSPPLPPSPPLLLSAPQPPQQSFSDYEDCGLQKGVIWKIDIPFGVSGLTRPGEFPWMVAVLRSRPTGQSFVCGGSIIYPNMILTTAHSVKDIPASELVVKAGVWNRSDISEVENHQDRKVQEAVIHKGFDKGKVANDFAILVLNTPLNNNDYTFPICLPSLTRTVNESACIATGWGPDRFGNQNGNTLKQVTMPLVDFDSCETKLKQSRLGSNFTLHESFLCAGGGAAGDTCVGDGGGPLMCASTENSNRYVQIGITSWGTGCGKGDPGVYSSVQYASDWIKEQANLFPPLSLKLQP